MDNDIQADVAEIKSDIRDMRHVLLGNGAEGLCERARQNAAGVIMVRDEIIKRDAVVRDNLTAHYAEIKTALETQNQTFAARLSLVAGRQKWVICLMTTSIIVLIWHLSTWDDRLLAGVVPGAVGIILGLLKVTE